MKSAVFQYKCRSCGKIYDDVCCGVDLASMIIASLVVNGKDEFLHMGAKVHLISNHYCNKKQMGITDLIGYKVKDEK